MKYKLILLGIFLATVLCGCGSEPPAKPADLTAPPEKVTETADGAAGTMTKSEVSSE